VSGFKLAVLASGTGSNLQAILDTVHGRDAIEVVGVGTNVADAPALARAQAHGIPTAAFPLAGHADRAARDTALADWIVARGARLVVLAGYMQLLTPGFLARFPQAVVNVHPALLPAFPGLRAVEQALEHGVRVFGVTVHYVDEGVDTGPIILQRAVELPHAKDADEVFEHIHAIEHELLPEAIRMIARGAVRIDPADSRRVLLDP
jgi:phosphoribosylglycinamide formyltransferase-1